ncbi:MAG: sel1 repeat family protein [Anaerolineales bacterium]|nr:sel1 repeat family protein [Anaerolineales bacterium]
MKSLPGAGCVLIVLLLMVFAIAACRPRETLGETPSAALLDAAARGDVEAQRQLGNAYKPTEVMGVKYGNVEKSVGWFRKACAAGYANAQVDFYNFADVYDETDSGGYLEEAIACLQDAIRQGHRIALISGAFRAAFIEHDYKTGYYLYSLFEGTEPHFANQRDSFADKLTPAEIDEAERAATAWRAANKIKDDNDFFIEVNSPFRVVPTTPTP